MKPYHWNENKNRWLKAVRGVCFEDVVEAIAQGNVLDETDHPNRHKYPDQMIMVVKIGEYAYLVPYREDADAYRLITVIPNRKATRSYLGVADEKEKI